MSWTYDKDNSDSRGSDSAWVDQVTFTPTYPVVHFDASTLALPGNTTLTTWGGQTAAGTPTHLLNQTPSGKPAVYFDGSDRMGENVIVPASAAQDFIIVAVVKPKSTGAYHNIVEDDTQSPMLWVRPAFQYEMNAGAGGTIAAGTGAGTDGWDIVIADSRLNQVYINSATPNATGGSAMAYPSSRPCDFFHRDGNQTYQGLVAEVRIYNDRAAFGGDFAGLYNEMRTKWIGTTPIARWVADDWAGGAANWVDRVGGKIASMGNPTWRPVKTPGVIFGPQNSTGIVFDGIDDYFSVTADQNPIAGKNNVTIAAVFKTTRGASGNGSWEQNPGPIYAGVPGTPNDWGLTYTAAGNAGAFFNTPIIPIPSISLIDGRTHSMILTWQDPTATPGQGVARLYVDGVLAGSTGVTDGGNGILYDGFVIGKETASTYRCFSGAIGELRFYDTVVDAAMLHSQLTTVNGYAQFANSSVTPGLNTAFSSVANPSRLPNGVVYALGTTPMNPTGKGKFLAPPTIPADVDVYLDRSPTLAAATWTPIASWVNGAAPVFASGVTLVSGEIRDTFAGPKAFYRYRVVQR